VDLNTGQKSNCHEVPNTPKTGKNIKNPGSVFDDEDLGVQKDQTGQTQDQNKLLQTSSSSKSLSDYGDGHLVTTIKIILIGL